MSGVGPGGRQGRPAVRRNLKVPGFVSKIDRRAARWGDRENRDQGASERTADVGPGRREVRRLVNMGPADVKGPWCARVLGRWGDESALVAQVDACRRVVPGVPTVGRLPEVEIGVVAVKD